SYPDRRARVAKDNASIARATTRQVPKNGVIAPVRLAQRLHPASAPQDHLGQYESSGKPASAPARVPARSLESVGGNSAAFVEFSNPMPVRCQESVWAIRVSFCGRAGAA